MSLKTLPYIRRFLPRLRVKSYTDDKQSDPNILNKTRSNTVWLQLKYLWLAIHAQNDHIYEKNITNTKF